MRLYHFTAMRLVDRILRQGLTEGFLPVMGGDGRLQLVKGYQWLTTDGAFDRQLWRTMSFTELDRTEVRLDVVIPRSHRRSLIPWRVAYDMLGKLIFNDMTSHAKGTDKHWHVFRGRIKPGWLRQQVVRGQP